MRHASRLALAPLLKWAGGKRQLLASLSSHYPARFQRYFEPFFGSGAVFFHLLSTGRLETSSVHLSDVNGDLIGCYRMVRDEPEAVIESLRALADAHERDGDRCYYDVRDGRFNPARKAIWTGGAIDPDAYTPSLAAMLIYLNRTGFNGLFRLNRHGGFNVPVGRYAAPRICDPVHVRRVSEALNRHDLHLTHEPFDAALARADAGDFVYCDPPYEPMSPTASFANYTASGFTLFDQERLQRAVVGASERGAAVVISNSSAPTIYEVYQARAARRAGLKIHAVAARRAINSKATARGHIDELIISNRMRMAKAGLKSGTVRRRRSA